MFLQGVPKNMLHFKILIKIHFFFFLILLHFYVLIYESGYEIFLLRVISLLCHGITYVSNDNIDDVIK